MPDVPNSPKPVFKLANENNLFSSPVEQWLDYANVRIATSHDYRGEKVQVALKKMDNFVADAIDLNQTLSRERWQ